MGAGLPWLDDIEWIFFDLGETLVDESPAIGESIAQFVSGASEIGYRFTRPQVEDEIRALYCQFAEFPMRTLMERWVPEAEHRALIRRGMTYRKNLEMPFAESLPLLSKLAARYRIGIIANQGPGTKDRMDAYGFAPFIGVCCASAESGMAKPDPRLFRLALEQAGCRPENAVMIGDRIDNDILPAHRLGMRTIWVRQGLACDQPVPEGNRCPDVLVGRIAELGPLLLERA